MTEQVGLLAAILDDPAADAPRLIFADWLEEHGQPERAEFIRVQCEIARLTAWQETNPRYRELCECRRLLENDRPCIWCRLRQRERELLQQYCRQWCDLPGPWLPVQYLPEVALVRYQYAGYVVGCRFCRGFVEMVRCLCGDWLEHGPAIVQQCPVQKVWLSDKEPFLTERSNRQYWAFFWEQEHRQVNNHLPEVLYNILVTTSQEKCEWTWPATRDQALANLSDACLRHARQVAAQNATV